MTDTDERLTKQLDDLITDVHPGWGLADLNGHRVQSPVEPCDVCGLRVFLMLPKGADRPMWLQLGDVEACMVEWSAVGSGGDGDTHA